MKRNLYALILLAVVGGVVLVSGRYVAVSTAAIKIRVQAAYQLAEAGQFGRARDAYRTAQQYSQKTSPLLYLMVRRSLMDEINESLALLGNYAQADNFADLSVETARVTEQLDQLQRSFLAAF